MQRSNPKPVLKGKLAAPIDDTDLTPEQVRQIQQQRADLGDHRITDLPLSERNPGGRGRGRGFRGGGAFGGGRGRFEGPGDARLSSQNFLEIERERPTHQRRKSVDSKWLDLLDLSVVPERDDGLGEGDLHRHGDNYRPRKEYRDFDNGGFGRRSRTPPGRSSGSFYRGGGGGGERGGRVTPSPLRQNFVRGPPGPPSATRGGREQQRAFMGRSAGPNAPAANNKPNKPWANLAGPDEFFSAMVKDKDTTRAQIGTPSARAPLQSVHKPNGPATPPKEPVTAPASATAAPAQDVKPNENVAPVKPPFIPPHLRPVVRKPKSEAVKTVPISVDETLPPVGASPVSIKVEKEETGQAAKDVIPRPPTNIKQETATPRPPTPIKQEITSRAAPPEAVQISSPETPAPQSIRPEAEAGEVSPRLPPKTPSPLSLEFQDKISNDFIKPNIPLILQLYEKPLDQIQCFRSYFMRHHEELLEAVEKTPLSENEMHNLSRQVEDELRWIDEQMALKREEYALKKEREYQDSKKSMPSVDVSDDAINRWAGKIGEVQHTAIVNAIKDRMKFETDPYRWDTLADKLRMVMNPDLRGILTDDGREDDSDFDQIVDRVQGISTDDEKPSMSLMVIAGDHSESTEDESPDARCMRVLELQEKAEREAAERDARREMEESEPKLTQITPSGLLSLNDPFDFGPWNIEPHITAKEDSSTDQKQQPLNFRRRDRPTAAATTDLEPPQRPFVADLKYREAWTRHHNWKTETPAAPVRGPGVDGPLTASSSSPNSDKSTSAGAGLIELLHFKNDMLNGGPDSEIKKILSKGFDSKTETSVFEVPLTDDLHADAAKDIYNAEEIIKRLPKLSALDILKKRRSNRKLADLLAVANPWNLVVRLDPTVPDEEAVVIRLACTDAMPRDLVSAIRGTVGRDLWEKISRRQDFRQVVMNTTKQFYGKMAAKWGDEFAYGVAPAELADWDPESAGKSRAGL